jgi:poly-beta-hydroxyalkanoate depolymerase
LIKGVGHYGTFNGGVFRRTIAPMITQFIQDADQHHEVTVTSSQIATTGESI